MTSGFRMTEYQFKEGQCVEEFYQPEQNEPWKFLEIEEFMRGSGKGNEYLKTLLRAGNSLAFKVWRFDPLLKTLLRVVLVVIALAIAAAVYNFWTATLPVAAPVADSLQNLGDSVRNVTVKQVGTYIYKFIVSAIAMMVLAKVLATLFGTFVSENALLLVRWKDTLRRLAVALFISSFGFVAAFIHLYIFDKRFLSLSTLEKIKQKNG
jgi:hypothetical protein